MPTRIMRRTPATEEAMDYGYGDLLRDIVGSVREGASRNVNKFLAGEVGNEEMLEMALAGVGGVAKFTKNLSPKMLLETLAAEKKFAKLGMKYDAYVNQIPDKPEFAYHQWTFLGEGPLKSQTLTTRGTSLREVEEMVADRMKKFIANPMRSNILK